MDHALPGAPLDQFYADPDGMLNFLCHHCALPFYQCMHAMPQAPYVPARMFCHEPEPEPFHTPLLESTQIAEDFAPLAPLLAYVTAEDRQPLRNEYLQYINENETTIQPATVQAHLEDIYTPGDRLPSRRPASRKAPHRRQAPRPGGYPCQVEGCEKIFDRACELK
ncbi:hypothetical protein N0V83_010058 [Neocucurbitaria cava]|uniref:Uncharacterized protein n=1 Tax=Neocucurbitaria cava TaxID=798079 RepID=A0A9W8XY82_9PLEO|nr:hypothetical protein N0V83_010058 [Neocucurbitaria cava]